MRRILATAVMVATLLAGVQASAAAPPVSNEKRVVLILAPYLMWSDVTATSTPAIWELARGGAVGAINARSRARQIGEPSSPLEGALTISAGAWAVPSYSAAAAYVVDERYEVGTAAEAFRRTTGAEVRDNRIVFLGMPVNQRVNEARPFEVLLGTLGQAVEDAGGITAAVGNSDVGYVTGEQRRVRPAALAAMNAKGLVALGDVSSRMLREDAHAPFGIETDMEAFAEALDVVISDSADSTGPSFIVLDAGDAYRATKFETQVTEEIALRHRQNALTTLDRVVTLARERFPDDVIILASQSTGDPAMGRLEGFGPIVISGGDRSGFLSSSSTQRAGLVTNLDLTATVLDALGLKRPVQVLGNEMVLGAAPARLEDRVRVLDRLNRTAVSVDSGKPGVVNTFVVFTVIVLALSAIVLVRSRYWSPGLTAGWLLALRSALLLTIAVPVSSWMQFLWWRWPATATQAVTALAITSAVVWIASVAVMRFFPGRLAVAFGCLLTTLVLLVDQFFGAPLSFTNFFGYSPLMAARFYGMGNEAAAMFFGASVVGAALVLDEWPRARLVPLAKRIGLPVFGVLVVVVSAAPFLGANVGVVAWGTVGFAVAWVLMNGYRFTWRTALLILAAIVALTLAFALFDIFAAGQQTHLARSLGSAADGGLVELWKIVVRKADTNVRVLTHTRWSYILIAVVAFLAFARWRPQGDFAATLDENPHFADAITVSLVAGLAAYFTEDSGIVIPALEVLYLGVALAWVMLARLDRGETR